MSGQRTGLAASFARGLLRVLEVPYSAAIAWRNGRFDRGRSKITRVSVPVISVGNLTTGGTGKTPLVEWIVRWLAQHNRQPAIVSRGYGAKRGQKNDEAMELALKLPTVPHLQNRQRTLAAQQVIDEFHADVIVLDDGFQHRRLHRDLDIVLLDALEPFGYGHLLPRGLLREPLTSLSRAHVVALSRADLVSLERRQEIQAVVASYAPQAKWIEVAHRPTQLVNSAGEESSITALAEQPVAAFCAIGNPAGFRQTLQSLGCDIVAWREYPDHHAFSATDLAELTAWLASVPAAQRVVCTLKDLVKIRTEKIANKPLNALAIQLAVTQGDAELAACLAASIQSGRRADAGA